MSRADARNASDGPMKNPLDPSESLKPASNVDESAHPSQPLLPLDSAVTKAEKVERSRSLDHDIDERPAKRSRLEDGVNDSLEDRPVGRVKGVASVKPEYLIATPDRRDTRSVVESKDDAAEESGKQQSNGRKKKAQGQNTKRDFGFERDTIKLCTSRVRASEFDPVTCKFGESCKFEHDIRNYLAKGKREDLTTLDGKCPLYETSGKCRHGWKCRFACSHSFERKTSDGRKELVLLGTTGTSNLDEQDDDFVADTSIVNVISSDHRWSLKRHKFATPKSDPYNDWLNKMGRDSEKGLKPRRPDDDINEESQNGGDDQSRTKETKEENRATYYEPPFLPSEKRRIYYGPETPVLAPLTTQGNLPFRRLCVELGAQITWSEMAMGLPLIQGEQSEWALQKAHISEMAPPRYQPKIPVYDYDNSKDFKFGAQIAGNKPWLALKATEALTTACPNLRAIDLNCGCPIDLVYRQGAGSALLDTPGKLEKILRGMNAVSGEVPVTVKIRMGTRNDKATAESLVNRLAFGGEDAHQYGLGPCGVAAVTLHGRSRQQRYTRSADWEYISQCASVIKRYNKDRDALMDTVREPDARNQANTKDHGRMYFIGNGDCYSHEDYETHISNANVDSIMIARGALIKPWIFEEVEKGQHLDKSGTERLAYIEKFVRNGLEAWGSDEIGVGTTRRFLLEWLSFACRYVPVGILEHLPPNIQDRPPSYRGRNELETLLSSDNYKDWIMISEMFLGKPHDNFKFVPKHKSNSYEVEAEG